MHKVLQAFLFSLPSVIFFQHAHWKLQTSAFFSNQHSHFWQENLLSPVTSSKHRILIDLVLLTPESCNLNLYGSLGTGRRGGKGTQGSDLSCGRGSLSGVRIYWETVPALCIHLNSTLTKTILPDWSPMLLFMLCSLPMPYLGCKHVPRTLRLFSSSSFSRSLKCFCYSPSLLGLP